MVGKEEMLYKAADAILNFIWPLLGKGLELPTPHIVLKMCECIMYYVLCIYAQTSAKTYAFWGSICNKVWDYLRGVLVLICVTCQPASRVAWLYKDSIHPNLWTRGTQTQADTLVKKYIHMAVVVPTWCVEVVCKTTVCGFGLDSEFIHRIAMSGEQEILKNGFVYWS